MPVRLCVAAVPSPVLLLMHAVERMGAYNAALRCLASLGGSLKGAGAFTCL